MLASQQIKNINNFMILVQVSLFFMPTHIFCQKLSQFLGNSHISYKLVKIKQELNHLLPK